MVAIKSLTVLLLAVLGSQADAALRRRKAANDKPDTRKLADHQKNNLFKDDEGFWSRYVQGVQSSLPVCVGDGGMLECPECCKDGACVPCPAPLCPGEDGMVGDGMIDCGDDCCEDGACVPCPAPVCPGEDGMVGDGMLDCGDDCCEGDACVPCPAPLCPGEDGMVGDGMLDCGDDCCEDDACVPCPAPVCPGEDGMVGDGMLDCGDDCCEDDACVPCPAPVCPGEDGMVGDGMLDCGDDCCEDDACVPCPAPVCIEDGGDLDCGADCCEAGACVPCPTPEECVLEMSIDCPECDQGYNTTVENCEGRPLQMTMLYAGGDCNMSRNCQDDKFMCEDFNGGAPFEYGIESWIVASDEDEETIFYEGWVSLGSAYVLNNDFEEFPADQIIKVYASENTEDESQLLQELQYHSSCSQNLDLLNRFGSQVIVGWFNEDQGNITGFVNSLFAVSVDIPIDAEQFAGQDATISGLTIFGSSTTVDGGITSPPETFNLTDSVAGTQVGLGDTFEANLGIPINLAVETEYTFLVTLSAETASGVDCDATAILQFTAGGSPLELGWTQACPEDED